MKGVESCPNDLLIKVLSIYEQMVEKEVMELLALSGSHVFHDQKYRIEDMLSGHKTSFNGSRHVKQDIAIAQQMIAHGLLDVT